MEKKLQKPYLTNQNLLIAQDLWQAHYQIKQNKIHKIKCKYQHVKRV